MWLSSGAACKLLAWFEHDQRSVAQHVQMSCAHLDPEVNAELEPGLSITL
ncbi:putative zinc ribbon protein [Escherichia coli]|nr:putative zinc ribbon protein [Escherichia coli]